MAVPSTYNMFGVTLILNTIEGVSPIFPLRFSVFVGFPVVRSGTNDAKISEILSETKNEKQN